MININSDLGEGAGQDDEILESVNSASVACGVYAGSLSTTLATVARCKELGVEIGAHPGYDDRTTYSRVELGLPVDEIEALVAFQVGGLAAVAPVAYIKAHGALYHRCQQDPAAADALARIAKRHGVGLMGQPGREIIAAAQRAGIPSYREGFADRRMLPDGSLAPRTEPDAVLDPARASAQALRLAQSGLYDTICIHGDSPRAGEIVAAVRRALGDAGIETHPLASPR